eukprot:4266063-Ditylum_brightwellii.AAC.1
MADGTTIKEAFNNARKLQWNIKSEKDGIAVYNNLPEKILMVRSKGDNGGWDYYHLTNTCKKGELTEVEHTGKEQEGTSSQ